MKKNIQFAKEIPYYGHFDVVVLGGGPAGVCAAIEGAEAKKSVLLVESTGMLGGMATSGLVGPFMTCYDREGNIPVVGGTFRRIIDGLAEYNAVYKPEELDSPSIHTSFIERYHRHVTAFDSYALQLVLDKMTQDAGVNVMLYTRFADCICKNDKIQTVILSALEGLVAVDADVYLDCTGNADVAKAAGVHTYKGEEMSGVPQPGTLMFEVSGVQDEGFLERSARPSIPVKAYRTPFTGKYKVNHYRVFGVDATNSQSMTKAHMEARKQVLKAYDVLRNQTQGFENAEIAQVAPVLGVRESRHIAGKYKITVDDIINGTKFSDRIATYGYGMDVHPRSDKESGNFKIEVAERYYIPYRSLIPEGCDNLIVAGKTISCESQAAGGLRCMPCAMAMGQAAGVAAVLAVTNNCAPENINIDKLQTILREKGAILD
ncbi:MAG: FAD-dependent oxidoreductase [Clostridia bacterium]|nr:FAD-dependent oxidoreductase [Clostridia bacterium]